MLLVRVLPSALQMAKLRLFRSDQPGSECQRGFAHLQASWEFLDGERTWSESMSTLTLRLPPPALQMLNVRMSMPCSICLKANSWNTYQ